MALELVGSNSWSEFIILTIVFFGWIAYMAASSLGRMWRPWWLNVVYGLILGAANRLLEMMLFQAPLLSLRGYVVDTIYIVVVMLLSYRVAVTGMMVTQYPWLYERSGPFGWREKNAA